MAEPCDPEVLHARVSVLESDNKRHESDLSKIWEKVTTLEVCASSLPGIDLALKEIRDKVDRMDKAITSRDAAVKAEHDVCKKISWLEKWQPLIAPIFASILTGLLVFGLAVYLHVFGAK